VSENDPAPLRQGETGPGKLATTTLFDVDETTATRPQIAREWDNRRAAERRMTSVPKRRREPGKHLVAQVGKRTVWLRDGDRGDRVFALLDAVQVDARQWDSTRRCWMVSVTRADDVLAFAEYSERWTVTCEAVNR